MGQCHKIVDISFGQSIPVWTQLQNSGVKYDSGDTKTHFFKYSNMPFKRWSHKVKCRLIFYNLGL